MRMNRASRGKTTLSSLIRSSTHTHTPTFIFLGAAFPSSSSSTIFGCLASYNKGNNNGNCKESSLIMNHLFLSPSFARFTSFNTFTVSLPSPSKSFLSFSLTLDKNLHYILRLHLMVKPFFNFSKQTSFWRDGEAQRHVS